MFRKILLIACAGFLLSACNKESSTSSPPPAEEIGYGEIKEGIYSNAYFQLSIKLPGDWAIQSQAAQKALMETGADLISGDDENLKKVLTVAEKQTLNMFSVFKYEQGTPVPFNPSIMAIAENVGHMPGIKKGADYHFHVKKILEEGQMNYEFPGEISTHDFSGVSFDMMPASINIGTTPVYQKYYAARIKDYMVTFILTYSSDAEESELENIMSGLAFAR